MKTYVIKNKEGKYFCGFDYFAGINVFSERIIDGLNTQTPTLKHCREEIKDFDLKDCQAVEITIAEVDNSKKEYNETIKYVETTEPDKVAEYIDKLNEQLAKKDKEVEELNAYIDVQLNPRDYDLETIEYNIRHQVCKEFRDWMEMDGCLTREELIECLVKFTAKQMYEILDQIEKGE